MINSHAHVYGKFVVICTTHSSFSGLDVFMTVQRKNTDVSNGSGVTIVFDSKRCLSIVFNEKKTSCVSQCSPSLQLCRVSKEICNNCNVNVVWTFIWISTEPPIDLYEFYFCTEKSRRSSAGTHR